MLKLESHELINDSVSTEGIIRPFCLYQHHDRIDQFLEVFEARHSIFVYQRAAHREIEILQRSLNFYDLVQIVKLIKEF
jgi:hypothetical protein